MVGGPHIHRPGPFYRYSATALSATVWFWIFYKVKNEGDVLLVRIGRIFLVNMGELRLVLGTTASMGSCRARPWSFRQGAWEWSLKFFIDFLLPKSLT